MSRARRASCFVAEEVGHVLLKNYMESCEDANYVISPVSVFIAMSMLKHGADGSTKDQLERALLVSPHTHGNEARHVLSVLLPSSDSLVAMSTANANGLFLQEGIEPALSFVTDMRRIFHASVESAKFGSLEGEQKINHWIERESLGKMKDLLTDTSEDDIMALINIVLLRGRWKEVFKKADTIHSNFHVSPEKTVKAEIMRQRGVFLYARKEIERFTVVFLPYRRKSEPAWEMGILVPDEGLNPIDYLKQLQPDALKKLRSEMEDETLVVHVPKFKSESFIDLKRYIMQMGAISPFTEHAEFPGIWYVFGICAN